MGFLDNAKKKAAEAAELARQKANEVSDLAREKVDDTSDFIKKKTDEVLNSETYEALSSFADKTKEESKEV